jgi:hypothetical protein
LRRRSYHSKKADFEKRGLDIIPRDNERNYLYRVDCGEKDLFVTRKNSEEEIRLNKKITLNKEKISLSEVMQFLFKSGMNIISDAEFDQGKSYSLHIKDVPLYKALDIICDELGGMQWEYRKEGFLVFRHPNSNRKRPQGLNRG